jgi:hypothetical protein
MKKSEYLMVFVFFFLTILGNGLDIQRVCHTDLSTFSIFFHLGTSGSQTNASQSSQLCDGPWACHGCTLRRKNSGSGSLGSWGS